MPTKTTLKAVGWTLAVIVAMNQFDATSSLIGSGGKRFFN